MKFIIAFVAIVAVAAARSGSNIWSLEEISQALQNPNINPAAVPYLEAALNQIMDALFNGQQVESAFIPIPAHLAVVKPVAVLEPEHVVEIPAPASGSPLVQIIVNVDNKQQEVSIPEPIVNPVQVVDEVIVPTPVEVVEESVIVPMPVVNPIDIIAVGGIESWGPDGSLLPVNAIDVGPM